MRSFTALVLACSVLASSAFAAGNDTSAPLSSGKPAGVKHAQLEGNGLLLLFGVAVVAGGIALVATQGNSGNSIAVSSTATAP